MGSIKHWNYSGKFRYMTIEGFITYVNYYLINTLGGAAVYSNHLFVKNE